MATDILKNQIICIESGSRGKGGALTEGIPSVGAEHLQGDGLITWNPNKMKYISPVFFKSLKSGILQKGDVLIVKDGATTGKVAYVSQLPSCAAINEHVFLLRSKPTLYSKFLFYYLQSPVGNHKVMKYYHGATVGGISKNIVNLEIPLPPLDEQRRIAAVLDKVSGLIAKRRQQLEMLDEMVKARFVEMFGDPLDEGCRYQKVPLGVVADVGSSKRIFEKEYVSSGVPFYRTKEIVELSKGHKITTELFITKERFAEICDEYGAPQKGDLLISAVGTIGVIWIVDGKNDFYFKDGNLLRVSVSNNFNPVYLKMLLETLIAAHKQKMSVGTAYAALTISMLKEMMVYLVPIDEQNQFAAFVKQTEKTKATINHSLKKLETLKNSLMQEYFG